MSQELEIVVTCALGLEEIVDRELAELGVKGRVADKGAVSFRGDWHLVWRCNWRLRAANRVLVVLARWPAPEGDDLTAGAMALVRQSHRSWDGLTSRALFDPDRTIALRATASASAIRDTRWVTLKVKDGLVDGQRELYGRRSSIERTDPDLVFRVRLHRDRATLLLDSSGDPLDRRGYRLEGGMAPVRENLAAACVLASGWDGQGPVVDPMCGSGTLLAEAALWALGRAPGERRRRWAFQRFPNFDGASFRAVKAEEIPAPGASVRLHGVDRDSAAVTAARANLLRAGLADRSDVRRGDAFDFAPPPGPGLVIVNPPYGERLAESPEQWRRLGDLFKQRYGGWRAVVLAGDEGRGKHVGLKPAFRLPVRNGPIDARILGFDLY